MLGEYKRKEQTSIGSWGLTQPVSRPCDICSFSWINKVLIFRNNDGTLIEGVANDVSFEYLSMPGRDRISTGLELKERIANSMVSKSERAQTCQIENSATHMLPP